MSDHQPPIEEEVVTVPPKKSGKNNKTIIIIISVIVGLVILGGLIMAAIGWFAISKTSDAINEAVEQSQATTTEDDQDDYDPYATKATADEHGGRVYDVTLGLPSNFPSVATIVQPSTLRQLTSQANKKGETPVLWRVITETEFTSVDKLQSAIESAYKNFGDKFDMTKQPGADQSDTDTVMQRYSDGTYIVSIVATKGSGYQHGSTDNFMVEYNIQVKEN